MDGRNIIWHNKAEGFDLSAEFNQLICGLMALPNQSRAISLQFKSAGMSAVKSHSLYKTSQPVADVN